MTTHPIKLLKALVHAAHPGSHYQTVPGLPYLAPALSLLRPIEYPKLASGTIGVTPTGGLLYVRSWVESMELEALQFVLTHEAMHLVLDHAGRAARAGVPKTKKARMMWNVAADLEINSGLMVTALAQAVPKPPNAPMLPSRWGWPSHLPAEAYYTRLLALLEDQQPKPDDTSGVGQGACGAGAGGAEDQPKGVDGIPEGEEAGEGMTAEVRSEARLEAMRAAVQSAVTNHSKGTSAGSVPGCLSSWITKRAEKPKVRWQSVLTRVISTSLDRVAGIGDFDWVKPSRRQGSIGFAPGTPLLPRGITSIPKIAVAIDSSGSMTAPQLRATLTEIVGLCAATSAALTVLTFDTRVHQVWTGVVDLTAIKRDGIAGRGGTNFAAAIMWARRSQPDLLVVCTDGWGPCPSTQGWPGKVLWLRIGRNTTTPAPFGRSIVIEVGS